MIWSKTRRLDKGGITEWGCEHGIGHPCRTHLKGIQAINPNTDVSYLGVHGCDGCCDRDDFPGRDYDCYTDPVFGSTVPNLEKE